jgi:flagellar protein FlgJ
MNIDLTNKLSNVNSEKIKEELKNKNDKKLKDACKDFEAFFLSMVFNEMRKGLPGNALFPDSNAKKIYDYMYYDALTREAVKGQSLGLGDMLYNYLKQFE